jgi:hypothetical protein
VDSGALRPPRPGCRAELGSIRWVSGPGGAAGASGGVADPPRSAWSNSPAPPLGADGSPVSSRRTGLGARSAWLELMVPSRSTQAVTTSPAEPESRLGGAPQRLAAGRPTSRSPVRREGAPGRTGMAPSEPGPSSAPTVEAAALPARRPTGADLARPLACGAGRPVALPVALPVGLGEALAEDLAGLTPLPGKQRPAPPDHLAKVARALAARSRWPAVAVRLADIGPSMLPPGLVDRLERAAAAVDALLAPGVEPGAARLDPAVLAEAEEIEDRLQRLLAHYFHRDPRARTAGGPAGSGYARLGARLGALHAFLAPHQARLSRDEVAYRADDFERAPALALVLGEAAAAPRSVERQAWEDALGRVLRRLVDDEARLRAALVFVLTQVPGVPPLPRLRRSGRKPGGGRAAKVADPATDATKDATKDAAAPIGSPAGPPIPPSASSPAVSRPPGAAAPTGSAAPAGPPTPPPASSPAVPRAPGAAPAEASPVAPRAGPSAASAPASPATEGPVAWEAATHGASDGRQTSCP